MNPGSWGLWILASTALACSGCSSKRTLQRPPTEQYAVFKLISGGDASKIKLVVASERTGKPLNGVPVQVMGTTIGALTDTNGVAEIGIAQGVYEVELFMVGYHRLALRNVGVFEGYMTDLGVVPLIEGGRVKFEPVDVTDP